MKNYLLIVLFSISYLLTYAQSPEQYEVSIEPITIADAPGLHSYVWGMDSIGRWLIIGGRNDGLHRRQPWASFWEEGNNTNIFVIDPESENVWNVSLDELELTMKEQLQSTNMQFYQHDNLLVITGGYAFSPSQDDHITFPYLTTIDVNELTDAVVSGASIVPYINTVRHEQMAVTGGQMGYMDDFYYLVGGQRFDGRYNPMGPDHGPGFEQTYSSEIKKFKVEADNGNPMIVEYSTTIDDDNLHRRDYNMSPTIFPNGEIGFTVYSGVFQKEEDLPFLDCVDIRGNSYSTIPNFNQLLSHYHCAKLGIYDSQSNTSDNLFFGGMSQFSLDSSNNLIQDNNVPFVKTISKVTRNHENVLTEIKLDVEMPTLTGSGAEFIPVNNDTYYNSLDILTINNLPAEKTLVGYIYGGIESTKANIFFSNDGNQSIASNVIFKVYIDKSVVGVKDVKIEKDNIYHMTIYPNPSLNKKIAMNMLNPKRSVVTVTINSLDGKLVANCFSKERPQGEFELEIDLTTLPSGTYLMVMESGVDRVAKQFILK